MRGEPSQTLISIEKTILDPATSPSPDEVSYKVQPLGSKDAQYILPIDALVD